MNTTENDANTGIQPLSWTSRKDWGSLGNTHRAEADGWKYTVDQPRKGQWVLRGWGPADTFLYRDGFTTMKAAKAAAGDHRDEQLAAMMADGVPDHQYSDSCPGACCGGDEPTGDDLKAALAALPAAAAKVSDAMRNTLAPMIAGFTQAARRAGWFRVRTCDCPTPTHTMRCGQGARPMVTRKSCTECGRTTTHKLDCSKGRI